MIMEPYFFVSYSSRNTEAVGQVVDALKMRSVNLWYDRDLQPGDNWESVIDLHLRKASGLLFFLSADSLASDWVLAELRTFAEKEDYPIVPVMLEPAEYYMVPPEIQKIQWFDITRYDTFDAAIDILADILRPYLKSTVDTALSERQIQDLTRETAREARGTGDGTSGTGAPDSVFIVHGHDHELLGEVAQFVEGLGIRAIVLGQLSSQYQTLIQKFFAYGRDARFAIVLISGDDLGTSKTEFADPTGGEKALQFRARQNVILELGFFYGLLGFENVFSLYKKPTQAMPRFERPSDLDGVLFDEVDENGQWRDNLKHRLKTAGFVIS